MLAVDMFFGRDIAGRAPVSDAEWTGFAGTEVTPRFPEGFTVVQGSGQWLNPATHSIGREASIVVRAVVVPAPDLAARVRAVKDDGTEVAFTAVVRVDTPQEVEYYRNGGILQTVVRKLLAVDKD